VLRGIGRGKRKDGPVATKRARKNDPPSDDLTSVVEQMRRISNLLALVAVKGEDQKDKVLTLSAAGYAPYEISDLLGTTSNTVRVTLSQSKSQKKKKRKPHRK
jgi:DNA-directed RNA polymerase specialized sigma24 family protein